MIPSTTIHVIDEEKLAVTDPNTFRTWDLLQACRDGDFQHATNLLQTSTKIQVLSIHMQPQPLNYACHYDTVEAQDFIYLLLQRVLRLM